MWGIFAFNLTLTCQTLFIFAHHSYKRGANFQKTSQMHSKMLDLRLAVRLDGSYMCLECKSQPAQHLRIFMGAGPIYRRL